MLLEIIQQTQNPGFYLSTNTILGLINQAQSGRLHLLPKNHSTEVTSFILLFSEVTSAISFERRNLGKKLEDGGNNLIDMHLIQS